MADEIALDPKVDFVAGTAAGVASLLVGHPFDTSTSTCECQARKSDIENAFYFSQSAFAM